MAKEYYGKNLLNIHGANKMAVQEIVIRKPYVKYPRPELIDWSKEKSLTRGSHQKETMINNIMAKYQKTGVITHLANHQATYDDFTAVDFKTAMDIVTNAQEMFDELPSSIRNQCNNNPEEFLDLVQNPEREAEAIEAGLRTAPDPTPQNAPEPAPEPSPEPTPA